MTSGSSGRARLTRFCTSTWAMSRSTPFLKVTVRLYWPSLVLCDDMYSMSSTPLTCCSIGAAMVVATTSALAPGYWQLTCTVGGVMRGYCASGKENSATPPASVMTMDSTAAKIGRSMKKRENTSLLPLAACGVTLRRKRPDPASLAIGIGTTFVSTAKPG